MKQNTSFSSHEFQARNININYYPHFALHQENCVVMSNIAGQGIGKWLIKACNSTYNFVCTRKIGQFLVSFFAFVSESQKWNCSSEDKTIYVTPTWIFLFLKDPSIPSPSDTYVPNIYVSVGNDSIKAVTEKLTWNDAKEKCKADKATLASFRNEWSQAYVELLVLNLKAPVWIGLNKNQVLLHKINTSCL